MFVYTPVILALRRLRQENQEFESSLQSIAGPHVKKKIRKMFLEAVA
jgi:hypothetical protein